MKGQELKILFNRDKAYLTSNKPITLKQAGLPEYAQTKGFQSAAYWIIKVINYIEVEKRISCKVLSYHTGYTELNYSPQLLTQLNGIEVVTFRDIDTGGLLKTLLGRESSSSYVPSKPVSVEIPKHHHQSEPILRQPYKKTIRETFHVPFKNVRFLNGGVSFDIKFQEHNKLFEFMIANDDIIEEFDSIKNYFANILDTKNIQVSATIELYDNEVMSISAESPEINKINRDLINKVRFELVKAIKKVNTDSDKNLMTLQECFEAITDTQIKSATFYNDDKGFLEDLLKVSDTKHYKHLRYLSSKHAHRIMKLRYVRNPFSFIFLLERDRDNYLVWETLNTEEATYVWRIDKDDSVVKSELERLEVVINRIKVQGRKAYLDIADKALIRVFHDYSANENGFATWKEKLERLLN